MTSPALTNFFAISSIGLQLRQGQQTHLAHPALKRNCVFFSAAWRARGALTGWVISLVSCALACLPWRRFISGSSTSSRTADKGEALDAEFQLRSTPEVTPTDQSNQQLLERLAADAPEIYETARLHQLTPYSRKNFFRFLSSAFTTSERYGEVLRNPEAISRALALFREQ